MASADDKSYDDINVTPMVDLYLVLLLIFIILTTAGVQGMKVQLPKSAAAMDLSQRKMQAITVNTQGKIALNTYPVSLAELESKLGKLKATTKDLPVVIRGDRKSQYQGVMDVLEVLGRVGIDNIGLAAEGSN
ncbi:ExbD/TolR family protein [Luteolibacter soli]|uniref:Biopolymer transporter ExbD n=1 Tax=Luteolibacter soli TaxID=3135280 RepID=A0ABU9AR04_9BACT